MTPRRPSARPRSDSPRSARRFVLVALVALCAVGAVIMPATSVRAQAAPGQRAPAFSAPDTEGRNVSLADHAGKYVVLEWVNPGCPFVRKHYDSGNLPATQEAATARGVVWLAINSTEPGHQDYRAPAELAAWMRGHQAGATATLMDPQGRIGRQYGAKTTPQMVLIDPKGQILYAGAIDSQPTANVADIEIATNYVSQAIREALAGKPVSVPRTRPYGCSVKYASVN